MMLLDTYPPTPRAVLPPANPTPVAWVVYTPTDKRQSLDAALLDSVSDHTSRYSAPTAVLLHLANRLALVPAAEAAGLTVYRATPGGIRVQAGTWGLA